jgi:ergothioneine biosynthesis glutamate--cysteine ligase EgtA
MGVHTASTSGFAAHDAGSAVAVGDPEAPFDPESARGYLIAGALTPGPLGAVGLELERHLVDRAAPASVVSWRRLRDALEGLYLPGGSRLTLEPGGQVELSTAPASDVCAAIAALAGDDAALAPALADAGLGLHAAGTDPVRGPVRIHPGDRYAAMAAYFSAAGYAADAATMMCSSASLQINVEAGPEHGWAERVAQVHRLTPALLALSASSPLLRGQHRGVRSERAAMWQRLDPGRCSPFTGHGDPAGAWASFALAAPVMLLRDPATGAQRPVRERVPLVSWLTGELMLGDRRPTLADLELHTTTLFPPVRLRGFLELRLLDSVPARWWPGLAALTVAVLDDPGAASRAAEAAEPVVRRTADAARLGITDPALARAARGVVEAALPAVPPALRPAVEDWAGLLESGRTPADLVLDRARRGGPLACLTAAELC